MENNKYLYKLLGTGKASEPDANDGSQKITIKYNVFS